MSTKNTKVKKDKKAPATAGVFIYVGPTSKKLTRYASFTNGLPIHMDEHMKGCPVLSKLFIPVEKFADFEQQLTDGSSIESMLFKKAQEYFEGVKG